MEEVEIKIENKEENKEDSEIKKFIEGFKKALSKEQKNGEKKEFEIEIISTKHRPRGIFLEIFTFGKNIYSNFLDNSKNYMEKALLVYSLCITVKEESNIEKLKKLYDKLLQMIQKNLEEDKDNFLFNFRNIGKKIYIDIVQTKNEYVKNFLDFDIDVTNYHNFKISLKSEADIKNFFAENIDIMQLLVKVCSLILSIKANFEDVKYLTTSYKNIKFDDEETQKNFDEFAGYLMMINAFIGTHFKFEFDGKYLVKFISSFNYQHFGKINKELAESQTQFKIELLKKLKEFEVFEEVKCLNLDEINLCIGFPKYQNGIAAVIKLPGLTEILGEILEQNNENTN